jgi:hypothetical protein
MSNDREEKPGAGPSHQEQSGSHHRTHEELAQAFRARITNIEAPLALREPIPAWDWIRRDLYAKWLNSPYRSDKGMFFKTLATAWELLIYDRFLVPGSATENIAGITISDAYKENPTIQLNETQVRVIDALTEVAGIPHPRGQTEIPIPEKFADLGRLRSSPEHQRRASEYEKRLAKWAAAQRRR